MSRATTILPPSDSTDRIFPPEEFRDALVEYGRAALDAAMMACDLEMLPIEARVALRDAFGPAIRKRMDSAASAHEMELDIAERRGRAIALEQMTRGMKVIADAMALARRTAAFSAPTPASEKYSAETLDQFVRGAKDQIIANIRIAWIAIGGLCAREQLPQLDPRGRGIYMSVALGRACGHALATQLRCIAPTDGRFAREMRRAFDDGLASEWGGEVEQLELARDTN